LRANASGWVDLAVRVDLPPLVVAREIRNSASGTLSYSAALFALIVEPRDEADKRWCVT
jgi:hypothetical protein